MSDYIKSNIGSGYNSATNINTELGKIETAIASKVDEEGGVMTGDLQMNSNDVLNAGQISTNTLILDGVALTANNPVNSDTTVSTTRIVATAGQTVFTVPNYSLGINAIQVFLNGVKLSVATDYAETNTTTITLTDGASEDDVFEALIGSTVTDANNYDSALVTYTQGGTGSVATNVEAKLQETISVKDFGAVGDGVTDDTAAIQAAIDSLSAGGVLTVPVGNYLVSSTITISNNGVHLIGSGSTSAKVKFTGTHTSGAVIKVSASATKLSDFQVNADATRQASVDTSCIGILYEGADVANTNITRQRLYHVAVLNQPSHGILWVGRVWYSEAKTIICQGNGGHGFAVDDGTLTSRTNKDQPGFSQISDLVVTGNGGHGLAVGNPTQASSTTPIRIDVVNYDSGGNATDASVRYVAFDCYLFGENHSVDISAFDSAVGAVQVLGRNIRLTNTRLMGSITSGIELTNHATQDTRSVVIDGIRCGASSPLDPAVNIANSNCRYTVVRGVNPTNITRVVSDLGTSTKVEGIAEAIDVTLGAGNTNNYDPEVSGDCVESIATVIVTADASGSTLTGILGNPSSYKRLRLVNTSANTLTLAHQSGSSISNYRIISPTGAALALTQYKSADLQYEATINRWIIVSYT
jgi:hypothetical protein